VKQVGDTLKSGGMQALLGDGPKGWQQEARTASANARAADAKPRRVQQMVEKGKGSRPEPGASNPKAESANKQNPVRVQRMEDGGRDAVSKYVDALNRATTVEEARAISQKAASELTSTQMNQAGSKIPFGAKGHPNGVDVVDGHLDARRSMPDVKAAREAENARVAAAKAAKSQGSMFGEASTKDKIAAANRAQEAKGRTGNPMNEGLFGSGKLQADLVDMAKQNGDLGSRKLTWATNGGVNTHLGLTKEAAEKLAIDLKSSGYAPKVEVEHGKNPGWSDEARSASTEARKAAPKVKKGPQIPAELLPNKEGKVRAFHGTPNDVKDFDFKFRDSYHFTPRRDAAEGYSKQQLPSVIHPDTKSPTPRVIEAELTMKNPLVVNRRKLGDVVKARNTKAVLAAGHDGVILWDPKNSTGRETEYIAMKKEQIKILGKAERNARYSDVPQTIEKGTGHGGTKIPPRPANIPAPDLTPKPMEAAAAAANEARKVSDAERAGRINRLQNRAGGGGLDGEAAEKFVKENLAKLEALDAQRARDMLHEAETARKTREAAKPAPAAPTPKLAASSPASLKSLRGMQINAMLHDMSLAQSGTRAQKEARIAKAMEGSNINRNTVDFYAKNPVEAAKTMGKVKTARAAPVQKSTSSGWSKSMSAQTHAIATKPPRSSDAKPITEVDRLEARQGDFAGAEKKPNSGLRGTQNAANRDAIIKNRKANAKPKDQDKRTKEGKAAAAEKQRVHVARQVAMGEMIDRMYDTRKPAPVDHAKLGQVRLDTAKAQAAIAKSTGSKAFAAAGLYNVNEANKRWNAAEGKPQGKRAAAAEAYKAKFGYAPPSGMSSGPMKRWTDSPMKVGPGQPGDPAYERVADQAQNRALDAMSKSSGKKSGTAPAEKPAVPAKSGGKKGGKALGLLAPVAIGAAALVAANRSAEAGESKGKQVQAAGTEAAKGAGVMAAFVGGSALAVKGLMKAGVTAAKAIPGVGLALMAGGAVHGAVTAEKGERLKGAARGAWDMSLPGMVANTAIAGKEAYDSTKARLSAPAGPVNGRLTGDQQAKYAAANSNFAAARKAAASMPSDHVDKDKGWSNAARIAAYQAKAEKRGFDPNNVPYGGKPQNGPSQWAGPPDTKKPR
jgi:hypothetical protein